MFNPMERHNMNYSSHIGLSIENNGMVELYLLMMALARLPYRNNTCINKCAAYSVNTGVVPIRQSYSFPYDCRICQFALQRIIALYSHRTYIRLYRQFFFSYHVNTYSATLLNLLVKDKSVTASYRQKIRHSCKQRSQITALKAIVLYASWRGSFRVRVEVRVMVFHGSFRVQQLGLLPVIVTEFGTPIYRLPKIT